MFVHAIEMIHYMSLEASTTWIGEGLSTESTFYDDHYVLDTTKKRWKRAADKTPTPPPPPRAWNRRPRVFHCSGGQCNAAAAHRRLLLVVHDAEEGAAGDGEGACIRR